MTPVLLQLSSIAMAFGPVSVLEGVDLEVFPGEVLALVGENGAGKSTLMRIAGGYLAPTGGSVRLDGVLGPATVREAEDRGIVLVHQEFCLAPHLTVAENIFLGREPVRGLLIDRSAMDRRTAGILAELGASVRPRARLADLAVSDWQMVELAKAFAREPRLILMDEPTAVLNTSETHRLFARIDAHRRSGRSVVFTSHKLDEVKQVADRVAVMRDGRIVHVGDAAAISESEMATMMVGRPLSDLFPAKKKGSADGDPILAVHGLVVPGHVEDASLELRRGEILGIAGLVGSGRTELFEGLCGLRPAHCAGFAIEGRERPLPSAPEAWRLGLAYLTEDRKGKGLLLDRGMSENLALTSGALDGGAVIDFPAEQAALESAIAAFDIRARDMQTTVRRLSGGNQQKLLVAKTLATSPKIVVFDEPTRGVDIGAKQQIYRVIADLAVRGTSCVVISSELTEIIGLAQRVLVLRRGRIVGELAGDGITEKAIVHHAMGLTNGSAANE